LSAYITGSDYLGLFDRGPMSLFSLVGIDFFAVMLLLGLNQRLCC